MNDYPAQSLTRSSQTAGASIGATAIKEPSKIEQQLRLLDMSMCGLNGAVADLHGQLRPILEIVPADPSGSSDKVAPPQQIVERLHAFAAFADSMTSELHSIRARLHI